MKKAFDTSTRSIDLGQSAMSPDHGKKVLQMARENTVGKGETARYEQFLLFPQCFQKI